jgi:hypothetical protein
VTANINAGRRRFLFMATPVVLFVEDVSAACAAARRRQTGKRTGGSLAKLGETVNCREES